MRVSFNAAFKQSEGDIRRASETLLARQREVSSGRRIHAPSDDPSATAVVISERAAQAAVDQYVRATNSVTSRLTVVDTILGDVIERLTAGRVAALGARGSTVTAAQREALASEIEGIRDAVLAAVNSEFRGHALFAGTASDARPYAKDALGVVGAYQGTTEGARLEVQRGVTVQITFDGQALVQGTAPETLFTSLENLAAAIRAGDGAGIEAGLGRIDAAFERAQQLLGRVGTSLAALEEGRGYLDELRRISQTRQGEYENANMAEAISAMNHAETAHRLALGAVAARGRLSLFDYLR